MSRFMDTIWPSLELDEATRKWVDYYASAPDPKTGEQSKPGVLRRFYKLTLTSTSVAGEQSVLADRFAPSGRYVRMFAMTFSGMLDNWQIKLSAQAGELYIIDFTSVSSLLNLPPMRNAAQAPQVAFGQGQPSDLLGQLPGRPLIWDPAIELEGTAELVLQGQPIIAAGATGATDERFVLNVCFHCWEFPDVPRSLPTPGGGATTQQESLSRARTAAGKAGR